MRYKFRAWDKTEKRLAEATEINYITGIITLIPKKNDTSMYDPILFKGEYELMQYTGLTDKNGNEIYEGDIVDIGIALDRKTKTYIGVVQYDAEMGCFKVEHPNIILLGTCEKLEVIGNIYENPKLLKEHSK